MSARDLLRQGLDGVPLGSAPDEGAGADAGVADAGADADADADAGARPSPELARSSSGGSLTPRVHDAVRRARERQRTMSGAEGHVAPPPGFGLEGDGDDAPGPEPTPRLLALQKARSQRSAGLLGVGAGAGAHAAARPSDAGEDRRDSLGSIPPPPPGTPPPDASPPPPPPDSPAHAQHGHGHGWRPPPLDPVAAHAAATGRATTTAHGRATTTTTTTTTSRLGSTVQGRGTAAGPGKALSPPPGLGPAAGHGAEARSPLSPSGAAREDEDGGSVTSMDMDLDVTDRILRRKGWTHPPTSNPHVIEALLRDSNPFKGRTASLTTASLMSTCVENLYFGTDVLTPFSHLRRELGRDDVVVMGPPRSGQTPILHILDYLRMGQLPSKRDHLVRAAPWIEAPYGLRSATPAPPLHGSKKPPGKLFKSYTPPHSLLKNVDLDHRHTFPFKIVAVLRDPLDLRVSWFRHVRRLFKKCSVPPGQFAEAAAEFDRLYKLDDFASINVPMAQLSLQTRAIEYEEYVAEVVKLYAHNDDDHLCVVFYEELLHDARAVVERLAEFTGWGHFASKEFIADFIRDSPEHPLGGNRAGSAGAGATCFSRESTRRLDLKWEDFVRTQLSVLFLDAPERVKKLNVDSYEALFQSITGKPFATTTLPVRGLYVIGEGGGTGSRPNSRGTRLSAFMPRLSGLSQTGAGAGGAARPARGSSMASPPTTSFTLHSTAAGTSAAAAAAGGKEHRRSGKFANFLKRRGSSTMSLPPHLENAAGGQPGSPLATGEPLSPVGMRTGGQITTNNPNVPDPDDSE